MFFLLQAEDGIRDLVRSRGLGDVYKRQVEGFQIWKFIPRMIESFMQVLQEVESGKAWMVEQSFNLFLMITASQWEQWYWIPLNLSLIHI